MGVNRKIKSGPDLTEGYNIVSPMTRPWKHVLPASSATTSGRQKAASA